MGDTNLPTNRQSFQSVRDGRRDSERELTQRNKEVVNGFINRMKLMSKAVGDEPSLTSPTNEEEEAK